MSHLSPEILAAIEREFDAIHLQVRASLGEADEAYIRRIISLHRRLEVSGRVLLLVARFRPALVAGTMLLTLAKIVENMEIGHGVVHGQWDWLDDARLHSSSYECDTVWPSVSWKRAHNYRHHTFTNVIGLDRDLGYSSLRLLPEQPWKPVYLLQPLYFVIIGALFDWAIGLYDLELDEVRCGSKSWAETKPEAVAFARKAARQLTKDYVFFPLLSGRSARHAAIGAALANVLRSLWTQTVVYCGHVPGGPLTFTPEAFETESRGGRYVRQLTGSCNIDGGPIFNVLTGHLGFQIEHHLFPGLPSIRYPEISERVKVICGQYELPYVTGRLRRQYGAVVQKILRLALPGPPRATA